MSSNRFSTSQARHDYSVQVFRGLNDARWDEFVAHCPGGHHEQTSLWGHVKSLYGWEPFRIIVSRNGTIVGGAQILKRRLRWIGNIGYVTRGPLAISRDSDLAGVVVSELDRAAKREKLNYLVIVPSYSGHFIVPFLQRLNFTIKPDFLPPGNVMCATAILDLTKDLDQIMSRMRAATRRHIRRGLSSGITIRQGGEDDIETFRHLMWALCERRGASPTPPQKDFFHNLWNVFHARGHVKLFLVEYESNPISAVIAFPFGDTVRFWKVGWAGDHAKLSPNAALYWEVIKWSKENGYRFMDFVMIDVPSAKALLRGEILHMSATNGMSFFKIGFGGQALLLPEPYYKLYNPFAQLFVRWGGNQLLASKLAARAASLFWSRAGAGSEG